jgi:hypothetical protein
LCWWTLHRRRPGLEEEDRGEAKVSAAVVSPEAEVDEDTVHMDKTGD